MRLYLVRHLQPVVARGVCYGRSDLAVDAQLQAAALPALRARLPPDAALYSSPLLRCASLAHALSPQVEFDPRLAELDFGAWEMRPWDTIARAEIDAWALEVALYRPGGGESVFDMARRIAAFYDELIARRLPCAVLVCHAGAMRLLAARARSLDPMQMALDAAARPHAIDYGEVMIIDGV